MLNTKQMIAVNKKHPFIKSGIIEFSSVKGDSKETRCPVSVSQLD